jgi:hypothetical protein
MPLAPAQIERIDIDAALPILGLRSRRTVEANPNRCAND